MAKPKAKRGRGRPPKYENEDLVNELLRRLELGDMESFACDAVGIDYSTLHRWKQKSDDLCKAIKKAIADGRLHHLKKIHEGQPGWQSSAWFLERKYRNEFGKDVAPPAPSEVVVKFADDEE